MNTATDVNAYISSFPAPVQELLQQVRQTIRAIMPEAEETMRYSLPTFRINNKNVIHFGAFKQHLGIYPTPSVIDELAEDLAPFVHAKGSIVFPYSQPFPFPLLKKIATHRLQQVQSGQ